MSRQLDRSKGRPPTAVDRKGGGVRMHRFTGKPRSLAPRAVTVAALVGLLSVLAVTTAGVGQAKTGRSTANIVFMSTQLTPVDEQQSFLNTILKGFPGGGVSFVAANTVPDLVNRVQAESQAGNGTISLAGATVGDLEKIGRAHV